MPCINPDGTLTFVARDVLVVLSEPHTEEKIRNLARQPLHRVRASLREMREAGLVNEVEGHYDLTVGGRARLEEILNSA